MNQYTHTRYGIIIKNTDNPMNVIGARLNGHTIVIEFADGYTTETVERLVREYYPTATHIQTGDKMNVLDNENGQTGIETLIITVCLVVVFLVAASWLIGQMDVVSGFLPGALGL